MLRTLKRRSCASFGSSGVLIRSPSTPKRSVCVRFGSCGWLSWALTFGSFVSENLNRENLSGISDEALDFFSRLLGGDGHLKDVAASVRRPRLDFSPADYAQ